ncbi:DMT family transporter [Pacificibacter marinus]|uniref:Putative DMT superfamily transporter inner membrane protein n=1 Tax=Pacificibacter marinus TaxID=658057 RepID=A0A1Y5TI79_9RHOB|nr:DMT family transporter [Pacificibacter marinus]SEL12554.1 Threonine/homoserine efflux transporter RhtA [Pacificibacter marinus]SLN60921.1 putative DMT superfamily transporter inner membrane protein [Pacificibacter marinus]
MDFKALLMGLAFVLMWSSAFTSARIIVADAPALASLALRFLMSGIAGVLLARALGQNWHFTRKQWRAIIIFGVCQNAAYLGLYFLAMRSVEASLASVLASSMPLVVALISTLFLHERPRPVAALGLGIGFLGVLLIMGTRLSAGSDMVGILMCVVGTIALAVATLSLRSVGAGPNVLMVVGLQSLIGSVVLAFLSPLVDVYHVTMSTSLVVAMLYTTFVPGLFATWLWFKLVERIGTVKGAAFHFLNPFFGVAIAAVLLGERVNVWDIVGVVTIMIGILAVQLSKA